MTKSKRIAVFLGHPAHFHMFKYMVATLEQHGVEVDLLVKRKDMLEELVQRSGHRYFVVRRHERQAKGRVGLMLSLLAMECNVIGYIIRRRPRLLIGTYAPVLSHLTGVKMIVCCEDDTAVVPRFARTSYPFATAILAPRWCDGGKWDAKMVKYNGFQKLAYLHPSRFAPRREVVARHLRHPDRPYVLLRFSKLQAHHDGGIGGITDEVAMHLIELLQPSCDIYITAERPIAPDLEPYRLAINPLEIHHWLAFAHMYIGDSQSMAVEAAMLGTPSVRFSDFVQKIGVLNALEERYHLTIGIPASSPERLYDAVNGLLQDASLEATFQERRQAMLGEQIDVAGFFTDFVEKQLCMTSR